MSVFPRLSYLTYNKSINAYSFDIGINSCSKNCELMRSGLRPYCISLLERWKNNRFIKPRLRRSEKLLDSKDFVKVMNREIKLTRSNKIRVYSYGDLLDIDNLKKWSFIAKLNPGVDFWLSTRQDHILTDYFDKKKLKTPDNLTIRYSLPLIMGMDFIMENFDKFGIVYSTITTNKKDSNCEKSITGNCGICSLCWKKGQKLIKYFNHGYLKHRLRDYLKFYKGIIEK